MPWIDALLSLSSVTSSKLESTEPNKALWMNLPLQTAFLVDFAYFLLLILLSMAWYCNNTWTRRRSPRSMTPITDTINLPLLSSYSVPHALTFTRSPKKIWLGLGYSNQLVFPPVLRPPNPLSLDWSARRLSVRSISLV